MTTRRTAAYLARLVLLVLLTAFFLVIGTATEAATKPSRKVYISTFADSVLRAEYDTATVEHGYCIKTRVKGDHYFVDSAMKAGIIVQDLTSVTFWCPDNWADAHLHLPLEGYDLYNPSPRDMLTSLCAKPRHDFSLIIAPKSYVAYGFRDDVKAKVTCR